MAELIDVACDICGQKYRRPEEEIGRKAKCRVCGTKFEVSKYTPPDELFEEEAAALGNPMPWIKGGATFALILLLIGGLGSLLFIKPASAKLTGNESLFQGGVNTPWVNSHRVPAPAASPARNRVQEENRAGATATQVPVVPGKAASDPTAETPAVVKPEAQASASADQSLRKADVDLSADYQIVETNGTRSGWYRAGDSSFVEKAQDNFPRKPTDHESHLNEARRRHEEIREKMRRDMEEFRRSHGIKSP